MSHAQLTEDDARTWDAVLPTGLTRVDGTPPPPPLDFEDGYVLPAHSAKPLAALHQHPLDAHLRFYEDPHVYTHHDTPLSTSVTALAHEHERPFVATEAVSAMRTSRTQAWPRLEYVTGAERLEGTWTPSRGALLHAAGRTVAVIQPHSMAPGTTLSQLWQALRVVVVRGAPSLDDVAAHSFERELRTDEIIAGWAQKGRVASHAGTEAHYQAELFFNGLPCRHWEPEVRVVLDFAAREMLPRGLVAHNTEKEIVCVDADLAGSIDLIVRDSATGVCHIVDFKRSNKLRRDLRGYSRMRAPLNHLDDCKGASYALQTSLYQYVLERDYGMRIGSRVLLSLHPDDPFCTSVPYLRAEVEYIMARRFRLIRARRAAASASVALRCALSDAPLVDAVRLDDDRLATAKAALVYNVPHTVDEATRASFESAVQAHLFEPEPRLGECTNWRELMPESGLPAFV